MTNKGDRAKRSSIPSVSVKGRKRRKRLSKLARFLLEGRAFLCCEICGKNGILDPAHIEPRDYTGENDTIENIIMACRYKCHDHTKYPQNGGLCITQKAAKKLVAERNEKYGIAELYERMFR